MVSKCANPACSKKFLYLQEGKIFHLSPTQEVKEATGCFVPRLDERFWLCDRCSKVMTLVWEGHGVKVIPIAEPAVSSPAVAIEKTERKKNAERRRRILVARE